MRLLHIQEGQHGDLSPKLTLREFIGSESKRPRYAILSHWREEEVLFADMDGDQSVAEAKMGYEKLEACCKVALRNGFQYVWCDTCCIDKSSSAELSEAINSMYEYYAKSGLCIAYLDDVEDGPLNGSSFARAVWFSRGWTLQELIAPLDLHFYSRGWKKLGTKASLSRETSIVSRVGERILTEASAMTTVCVSEKMSWAARRITTRPEDRAYGLMGIFGVNMPPLYGEGAENAFRRLQLEIIRTTTDHTLFAWDSDTSTGDMLAPSVSCFIEGGNFEPVEYNNIAAFEGVAPSETVETIEIISGQNTRVTLAKVAPQFKPDFAMTNSGLHIQVPMEKLPVIHQFANDTTQHRYMHDLRFAFLACKVKRKPHLVAICLRVHHSGTSLRYSRTSFGGCTIHYFPTTMFKRSSLSITNFNPVWVSKAPIVAVLKAPDKLPPTVTRLNFEVWYKGATPVTSVLWSRMSEIDPQSHLTIPVTQVDNLGRHAPQTFTQSPHRVQHYITGSFTTSGFPYEVISFVDVRAIDVAFGMIDRNVWVRFHPGSETSIKWLRRELMRNYEFPTGDNWYNNKIPICLVPGCEGSYEAKQNKGGLKCNVQYALQRVGDKEIVLRIYLSPLEGRSLKGWVEKTLRN